MGAWFSLRSWLGARGRRKTEGEGEPRLIHTVRGVGYALREQRA